MGALERIAKPKIDAITSVIAYVERLMPRVIPLLLSPEEMGTMVRHVHAAALVRVPGLLKAVRMQADAGLIFEAESNVRTLVDLGITTLWVGQHEDRAERVRDHAIEQRRKSVEKLQELGMRLSSEAAAAFSQRKQTSTGRGTLPSLADRAKEADDPDWAKSGKGPSQARALYIAFGQLSGSSHGELTTAYLLVKGLDADLLPTLIDITLLAAFALLVAVAKPLKLEDAEPFLRSIAEAATA